MHNFTVGLLLTCVSSCPKNGTRGNVSIPGLPGTSIVCAALFVLIACYCYGMTTTFCLPQSGAQQSCTLRRTNAVLHNSCQRTVIQELMIHMLDVLSFFYFLQKPAQQTVDEHSHSCCLATAALYVESDNNLVEVFFPAPRITITSISWHPVFSNAAFCAFCMPVVAHKLQSKL